MRTIITTALVFFSQNLYASDDQEVKDSKQLAGQHSGILLDDREESEQTSPFEKVISDVAARGQSNGNANGEDEFVKEATFFCKAGKKAKKIKQEGVKQNVPPKPSERTQDVKEKDMKSSFPKLLDRLEEKAQSSSNKEKDLNFIKEGRFMAEAARMAEEDDWLEEDEE